jgi:hypothetical protein
MQLFRTILGRMQIAVTFAAAITLSLAPAAAFQPPAGPQPLTGGGDVSLRREGDDLLITVNGPRRGLASLCVGNEASIRILHASAAVGQATYERSGDTWALQSKFDFTLRETRTGPPSQQERNDYFSSMGWVANASRAGDPKREFRIRVTGAIQFVGVTFFTTDEPAAISHWPASMDDDCRGVRVAQGFLPETANFRPGTWHRVR